MRASNALIRRILEISQQYGHHHLPGTLSAASIMEPIFNAMGPDDVFILSKGHAAVALYACLERKGYHPDLSKTHPERDPANGIVCTTGSLGHGLPIGVGIALGKKLHREEGTVIVLLGDGECLEGTTWESLNLSWLLKLNNLRVYIDGNGAGALGALPVDCTGMLIRSFPNYIRYKPTQKGAGISFLEGQKDHKRVLTDEEYKKAMEELA